MKADAKLIICSAGLFLLSLSTFAYADWWSVFPTCQSRIKTGFGFFSIRERLEQWDGHPRIVEPKAQLGGRYMPGLLGTCCAVGRRGAAVFFPDLFILQIFKIVFFTPVCFAENHCELI